MVKENLAEVEAKVNKAESELVHSSLKRAISSIPFFSAVSSILSMINHPEYRNDSLMTHHS